MKATGIVRRIDDLGRVVIPSEVRRTLKMHKGDPLEFFLDHEGGVVLKKYSPVNELGDFAKEYCDSLYEVVGNIILIADCDNIVAVAGAEKKEFWGKPISTFVEEVMADQIPVLIADPRKYKNGNMCPIKADEKGNVPEQVSTEVIAPIVVDGNAIGAVIIATRQSNERGDVKLKLAEAAANFLSKYIKNFI